MRRRFMIAVAIAVCVEPARADDGHDTTRRSNLPWQDVTAVRRRMVAEEVVVLPEGVDIGGQLRLLLADGGIGPRSIKLTDVALFDATAKWGFASHFQLDAAVTLLAKQPTETGEQVVQGARLGLTVALSRRTAVAASGTLRPLLALPGTALEDKLIVEHRHRLNEYVTFALTGGASSTWLRTDGEHALIVEATGHAAVLAREPGAIWGAWLGIGYSVPLATSGNDPVTGMSIDPQPRLDVALGNAVQVADRWDLVAEIAIVDRGDLANPATRLPILDGGFDQVQVVIGVSRRLAGRRPAKTWAQRIRGW